MNPFILLFADGRAFFIGLLLVILAAGLLFKMRVRFLRPVLTVLVIVGILAVIISATPLPVWAYAVWIILALTVLVFLNISSPLRSVAMFSYGTLWLVSVGLFVLEVPHHRRPNVYVAEIYKALFLI